MNYEVKSTDGGNVTGYIFSTPCNNTVIVINNFNTTLAKFVLEHMPFPDEAYVKYRLFR